MNSKAIALVAVLLAAASAHAANAPAVIDLTTNPSEAKDVVLPRLVDGTVVYPNDMLVSGTVVMSYVVATDGSVMDVKVERPVRNSELNEAAVSTALSRHYQPAIRDGAPVAVRISAIQRYGDGTETDADQQQHAAHDSVAPPPPACRFGTHHIAVDACSAVIAGAKELLLQEALYYRAHAYQALGQYADALADLNRLIEFQRRLPLFRRARGFIYEVLGQYQLAIDDYDGAVTDYPDFAVARFDLGLAYNTQGRRDRAVAAFERGRVCLRFDPLAGVGFLSNPAVGRVGTQSSLVPCKTQGVLPLEKIVDVPAGDPNEAPRLRYRCWARAMWNRELDGALADCDRALALNPAYIRAIDARALVRFRMGNSAEALKDLERALAINPKLASALYLRGVIRWKAGDATGGSADILAARIADAEVAARYGTYEITP